MLQASEARSMGIHGLDSVDKGKDLAGRVQPAKANPGKEAPEGK